MSFPRPGDGTSTPLTRARAFERRIEDLIPRWGLGAVIVVVLLAALGTLVRVPYYSIGPGPTRDVLTLIRVEDVRFFPSKGKLLLTTASVSQRTLTVWEWVGVWFDPSYATIPQEKIIPSGTTDVQQDAQNVADIEQSKLDAELAVFDALGEEVDLRPGARVLSVVEGSPADGELERGDVIVEINGRRVSRYTDVSTATGRSRAGARLVVRRGGRERVVRLRTVLSPDGRPVIGVFLGPVYRLPYEVEIDTQRIVGPSAGLAFAISLSDLLVEEDLTRGNVIAVTGTINRNGEVDRVGGVGEKVRAAERDGASYFIVPASEVEQAQDEAPPSMEIIGVQTLADAIAELRRLPQRAA